MRRRGRTRRACGTELAVCAPAMRPCAPGLRNLLHVIAECRRGGNPAGRGVRLLQQARFAQSGHHVAQRSPNSALRGRQTDCATACEATGSPVAMYSSMMAVSTSRSRGLTRTSGIFFVLHPDSAAGVSVGFPFTCSRIVC